MNKFSWHFMVFLIVCSFVSFPITGASLDLNKPFIQKINEDFLTHVKLNSGNPRTIFLGERQTGKNIQLLVFHQSTSSTFLFRTRLTQKQSMGLNKKLCNGPTTPFSALHCDGSIFYTQGVKRIFPTKMGEFPTLVEHVPYVVDDKPNQAFHCDLGLLRFTASDKINSLSLHQLLEILFPDKSITLAKTVFLNRYYFDRPDYLGVVNPWSAPYAPWQEKYIHLPPTHKISFNKNVIDEKSKDQKDRQLVFNLLRRHDPLLSQDERVKRGQVPSHFKLKKEGIANSDLGCGQNVFVFTTLGAGINYFDRPWNSKIDNLPGPRFVYHAFLLGLEKVQVYPSWSIAPREKGLGRMKSINQFQANKQPVSSTEQVWMKQSRRAKVVTTITKKLLDYGITNSSKEVKTGIDFEGKILRGSIVNNEVRLPQTAITMDTTSHLIIPKNKGEQYLLRWEEMQNITRGERSRKAFIGGQHYLHYFVEAPIAGDSGMRIAYLQLLLKKNHPTLYQLLKKTITENHSPQTVQLVAKAISTQIKKQGLDFFTTKTAKQLHRTREKTMEAWFDLLEAERCNYSKKTIMARFNKFEKLERISSK